MTQVKPISCDTCQDLLTDLLCGELSSQQEREVRTHASTCQRCGGDLAGLGQVMRAAQAIPLSTPSPLVDERILAAAKNALAGRPLRPIDHTASKLSALRYWLARAGAWAMSPQVAMASLLVLMVGIGLLAWPLGNQSELTALRPAGSSRSAAPAATATGAPVQELAPNDGADEAAEASAEDTQKTAGGAQKEERNAQQAKGGSGAREQKARASARQVRRARQRPRRSQESASSPKKLPAPRALDLEAEGPFAPPPPTSAKAAAASEAEAADDALAGAAPGRSVEDGATQLQRAIALVQAGHHDEAIPLLTPLAKSPIPLARSQARLWLARAYRGRGDCERALVYYGPVVDSSSASKATLEEAADCFDQTGDADKAKALRERAELR